MSERKILVASRLHTPPSMVWPAVGPLTGGAHELGPWLRLTWPDTFPFEGTHVTWVRLLGVVPIDRLAGTLAAFERGELMAIEGRSLWFRRIFVERRVVPISRLQCKVVDQMVYDPRLPWAGLDPWLLRVFIYRHHRLQQTYGGHFTEP